MLTVILSLSAGAVVGYWGILKNKASYIAGPVATVGVMLLLFFMGAKIGSDGEIMAGLGVMGLEALTYAVAAIVGSIALVWLGQVMVKRIGKGNREGENA
ncbi:MAG TPA: LysO family transporter [bacterium]|nr:LysO family transporter [bacterium]